MSAEHSKQDGDEQRNCCCVDEIGRAAEYVNKISQVCWSVSHMRRCVYAGENSKLASMKYVQARKSNQGNGRQKTSLTPSKQLHLHYTKYT